MKALNKALQPRSEILDLLGGGGMFVEFFSTDFGLLLMGHDGHVNINVREGRARLRHLPVHHKSPATPSGLTLT